MSKIKTGISIQPLALPDVGEKRHDTIGQQPQPPTKRQPETPRGHCDPKYASLIHTMTDLGMADPHWSDEETAWQVITLSGVMREVQLMKERFGPPPVEEDDAAMTEYMNQFFKPGATVNSTVRSDRNMSKISTAEPPSPSTTSSSSSSLYSVGSTIATSVDSPTRHKDGASPEPGHLGKNEHNNPESSDSSRFSAFANATRSTLYTSPTDGHHGSDEFAQHFASTSPGHFQMQEEEHERGSLAIHDVPPGVSAHEFMQFKEKARRYTLSMMMKGCGVDVEYSECRASDRDMRRFEYVDGAFIPLRTEPAWSTTARAALEMLGEFPFQLAHPEVHRKRHAASPKKTKSKTTKSSKAIRTKVPAGSGTPRASSSRLINTLAVQSCQSCSSSSSSSSSSTISDRSPSPPPTPPPVSPENRFYARLVANIRVEAYRNMGRIDESIRATLMSLYIFVFNRGPCPSPISGICGTPVCCNASPMEYMRAGNDFIDFIMSLSDPEMVRAGMWGLKPDEVNAIRGIVFLRFVTGWFQEDVESGDVVPVRKDYVGKGKERALIN